VENLVMKCFNNQFQGRRVLVTGHTGFKGSWLSEWLLMLGAEVTGLALHPQTSPSLFDQLGLAARLDHRIADIRDLDAVRQVVDSVKPDFVFHLAAQPLVRYSYDSPVETFETNVLGTVNLLESMRPVCKPCTVIAVTTDKCYENREWLHSYRDMIPTVRRRAQQNSSSAHIGDHISRLPRLRFALLALAQEMSSAAETGRKTD
jgi:CDP-glucose 4,6-dehydratase